MPEGKDFVDKNLHRMTRLILGQNPESLSPQERGHISTSLRLVADILLEMTPDHLFKSLSTIAELFDDLSVYYACRSNIWSNYVGKGLPEERIRLLKKFVNCGGYERLCVYSASSSPEDRSLLWSNGEHAEELSKLLKGLADISGEYAVKEAFVRESIRGLETVTDAQMKNDALLESLNDILEALKRICQYDVDISSPQFRLVQIFYPFWLNTVDKMLSGSKLQVRLLGWDQLNYLIVAAHKSKPRALKYLVTKAGVPEVNGEYVFRRYNSDDQSVVYCKEPTNPEEPLLTLFRCRMQNNIDAVI